MATFWFVGEGPRDVGTPDGSPEGAMPVYVERIVDANGKRSFRFKVRRDTWRELKAARLHGANRKERGLPTGYEAKVLVLLGHAHSDGIDALICSFDRDRSHGYRLTDARHGRKQARDEGNALPCVLAMPIEKIEAWLLGDGNLVTGIWDDVRPEDIRHPEMIGDPKPLMDSLLDRRDVAGALARLARDANLTQLRNTCPQSFAPFYDEVVSEIVRGLKLQ